MSRIKIEKCPDYYIITRLYGTTKFILMLASLAFLDFTRYRTLICINVWLKCLRRLNFIFNFTIEIFNWYAIAIGEKDLIIGREINLQVDLFNYHQPLIKSSARLKLLNYINYM